MVVTDANLAERKPINILIVGASPNHAELVERELGMNGYEVSARRAMNAFDFNAALAERTWDVVIADYAVAGFGALHALNLLKETGQDIPCIIVSGAINDELAVKALRAGARDYVLKSNIARLIPAVEREMRDAIKRRQECGAEEALRLQALALQAAANAIVITNRKGNIEWVNSAFTKLTGYTEAEALGQNPRLLNSGMHDPDFYRSMWATLLVGNVWRGEITNRRKDGTLYVEEMTITPVSFTEGEISHFVGVKEDISERKRVEKDIAHKASFPRLNPNPILETDMDGSVIYANPAACALFPESDDLRLLLLPDFSAMLRDLKLEGDHSISREIQVKGKAFQKTIHYLPELGVVRVYFVDVTERKRAEESVRASEEALAESERRYRSFVEASAQVIWRTNPEGQVDVDIPAWNQFTGQSPGEAHGWGWMQAIIPGDRDRVSAAWRKASQTRTLYDVEYCLRRHDGALRQVHARGVPILEGDGSILEWIGTCIDVTEQRQAEAALRSSEERLKTVVENLSEGVIIIDSNGEAQHWNAEALRIHGFENEVEAAGFSNCKFVFDLYSLDGRAIPLEDWPIRRLMREEHLRNYEVILRRKQGEWERIFNYSGTVVKDALGKAMGLLSIHDVTNVKNTEKMLIRSEKLASVGRMSATIAHEINNPLASAMNAIFLASMDSSISATAHHNLELASSELERVAHITRQTLGFYRETGKPGAVCLPEIVDGVLGLYGSKLGNKSITVHRKFRSTARVHGIEGELRQIVSNLVSNAIDAVRIGGVIHVRTSGPTLQPGRSRMVRFTIADNGSGISAENLSHIFEAFFTTKEAFGTGLGLWVTKELIEKHEGQIRVRSRIGKGTVFSILLPLDRRLQYRDDQHIDGSSDKNDGLQRFDEKVSQ